RPRARQVSRISCGPSWSSPFDHPGVRIRRTLFAGRSGPAGWCMATRVRRPPDRLAQATLVLALAVGAALRLVPLGVRYLHPDQEIVADMALRAFAERDWLPTFFMYPSGFWYLVRGTYTAGWMVARAWSDAVPERIDVVAAYLADPVRFLLVPRAW